MPNWCSNDVEMYNESTEKVDELVKHFVDMSKEGASIGLFGYFIPMPADQEENWYNWNIANWGTKWEVNEVNFERVDSNTIRLSFDTAWAPPTAFYMWLNDNTSWYVNATYFEPGMCFVGRCLEGDDEYYEYSDLESLNDIPVDLVEIYDLETMLMDEIDSDEWDAAAELDKISADFEEKSEKNAFDDEIGREWLRGLLKERAVSVVFTKKDGTEREMRCTLNENMIPAVEKTTSSSGNRKQSSEAQPVFDLDAQGWRSFRWDSVKTVNFSLG